jgi:hypothetical protein
MSDRCTFFHKKHKLSSAELPSNLPLFVCSRCHRIWEFNGAERKYFKMGKLQKPEWSVGYITLDHEELNPALIEYVIKFKGIQDKSQIDALRKMGKESKINIANYLFKI